MRRKPVPAEIFDALISIRVDLSKVGRMLPFCFSPTTDMQLSLPLINLRYNINGWVERSIDFFSLSCIIKV